jgi:hypothetical protein
LEIVGEEGKEEFKLQTSWRMVDSSGGREDGGGVVETATKNLKKLNLVLFTAIDPTSILPPGLKILTKSSLYLSLSLACFVGAPTHISICRC